MKNQLLLITTITTISFFSSNAMAEIDGFAEWNVGGEPVPEVRVVLSPALPVSSASDRVKQIETNNKHSTTSISKTKTNTKKYQLSSEK